MNQQPSPSQLITQLRQMAAITKGSNLGAFCENKANSAVDVRVVRCAEVLTPEEIHWVKTYLKPQRKQCYKNALLLAQHFDCQYVEGQMLSIIGIDHAFNKIRGSYIDVTKEFALGEDPSQTEYVALGEYTPQEASSVALSTQQYGNVFEHYYLTK